MVDPYSGFKAQYGYRRDLTGLYYCTYRYYHPEAKRWLTRDPIGFAAGPNQYAYCCNNPINKVDPFGTDDFDTFSNFWAGYGDTLSLGLTKIGRKYLGLALGIGDANESVDYSSMAYFGGEVAGTVHGLIETGATGIQVFKAAQSAGKSGGLSSLNYFAKRGTLPDGNVGATHFLTGEITISDKLSKGVAKHVLKHEMFHRSIILALPNPLRYVKQGLYQGTKAFHFLEELGAESYAAGSFATGFKYARFELNQNWFKRPFDWLGNMGRVGYGGSGTGRRRR